METILIILTVIGGLGMVAMAVWAIRTNDSFMKKDDDATALDRWMEEDSMNDINNPGSFYYNGGVD